MVACAANVRQSGVLASERFSVVIGGQWVSTHVADWSDGLRDHAGRLAVPPGALHWGQRIRAIHTQNREGHLVRCAFQRLHSWSICVATSLALAAGCASSSGGLGAPSGSPLAQKAEASGFQMNGEKSYSQYSKEYQQRPMVSPGMGADNKAEPSAMQKFGAGVAAVPTAIGNSAKSGASKVKDWMTPDDKPASTVSGKSESIFASKKTAGPALYISTAAIYERAGKYDEAADQYEKALKVAPNHLPTMLSYAHMLDRQGRLEDAAKLYEVAAKKHPNEAAAHNDLGLCYSRRGHHAEAIRSLTKATELQPKRELYRNNLALVLVEQNRSDEALAQLMAVQSEAVAHYNLGYLLAQRGREQLAASHFQRAAMLDSSLTAARMWSDQLTQRMPIGSMPNGSMPNAIQGAPPAQVASVPAPTQRPVSYGMPPSPGPAPTYLRSDPPPGGDMLVGNRYRNFNPSLPPTPDQVNSYKPELGNDLQFLPPVQ